MEGGHVRGPDVVMLKFEDGQVAAVTRNANLPKMHTKSMCYRLPGGNKAQVRAAGHRARGGPPLREHPRRVKRSRPPTTIATQPQTDGSKARALSLNPGH